MDTSGADHARGVRRDPRSRHTERALRRALIDLATADGLAAVTASTLIRTAGIGRATFYRHHDSVAAFIESLRAELIVELRDSFRNFGLDSHTQPGTYDVLATRARAVLLVAAQDVELFRLLWEGATGTDFRDRFRKELAVLFADDLSSIGAEIDPDYCPPEYVSAFVTHALTGVLSTWLAKARRESIEDTTFYLVALVNSGPDALKQQPGR